jgi:uncharacterized small protein (DUF1192 family)
MATKISVQEKQWRAENDARTLINAEILKQDKARLALAKKEISRIEAERMKEVQVIKKVKNTK